MPRALLRLLFCALAYAVGPVLPALAHPHVFVSARAEILYNADGAVRAVKHVWSFDEAYSAYITQGLDKNGDGDLQLRGAGGTGQGEH